MAKLLPNFDMIYFRDTEGFLKSHCAQFGKVVEETYTEVWMPRARTTANARMHACTHARMHACTHARAPPGPSRLCDPCWCMLTVWQGGKTSKEFKGVKTTVTYHWQVCVSLSSAAHPD